MKAWARESAEARAEVRGNARGAEAIVKNGLHDGIIAFNVVIDREGEVRHAHAVMPVNDRVDSGAVGKVEEGLVDAVHEMVENPIAAFCVEVLRFDKVEFGERGQSDAFHVRARRGGLQDGPSHPTSHRREPCPRRRGVGAV